MLGKIRNEVFTSAVEKIFHFICIPTAVKAKSLNERKRRSFIENVEIAFFGFMNDGAGCVLPLNGKSDDIRL